MENSHHLPIGEYRSQVAREALALLKVQPSFYQGELAQRIGCDSRIGTPEGRKLRRQLETLCKRGVLILIDRGIYVAGDAVAAPDIGAKIRNAARNSGGILSMSELMAEVAGPGINQRTVRDHLVKSDTFVRGLPLEGYRNHWRVTDDLRRTIPVPGHRQMLELRIIRLRAGLDIPAGWEIAALEIFQCHVGNAIRARRILLDLDITSLAGNRALLSTLGLRLTMAKHVRPMNPTMADEFESWSDWWTQAVTDHGDRGAFVQAWEGLESQDHRLYGIQMVLNVQCWEAMGKALVLDPAALSRGALS